MKAEPWVVDCYLRNATGASAKEYKCRAAVWADSDKTCRARLDAFLRTTSYRALRIETCLPAATYTIHEKEQARIGALVGAVNPNHLVELNMLPTGEPVATEPTQQLSFKEALLALDHKAAPVFAVLDGAQFDNLPEALFDGDFVSKPLYLDRGENDPEQVITAPHMVWLDERTETVSGRPPAETIPALLELIDNRPAAVFWQCPEGSDALYKHLRGINMVLYPKDALDDWEEPELGEAEGGLEPTVPDTHTLVLFRHADANVMTQVLSSMTNEEMARLYGPANNLLLAPHPKWTKGSKWIFRVKQNNLPQPKSGSLRLTEKTLMGIEAATLNASRPKIIKYLKKVAPKYTDRISKKELNGFLKLAEDAALKIGLKTEMGLGLLCFLSLVTGGALMNDAAFLREIEHSSQGPDTAVKGIFDDIAGMSDQDMKALEL